MTAPVYGVSTPADVALTAATAKTVLAAIAHANSGLQLNGFDISFGGVTATDVPVLIEICQLSGATAGTSTSATITQESGLTLAAGFTAQYAYTAEPTALTVMRTLKLTPNGGLIAYDFLEGKEPQCGLSPLGIAMRLTSPSAFSGTNGCRASFRLSRI